ncbi:hypothetical protein [Chryseobacterium sp. MEBOG07]|uniref:hypothetical protein n=1 Tax=Chryseobacterium sp. MEBOG07 TaxID=2879939 RepID=UPI001F19EE0A|nr:hypothetical protein [Chryseobacterium sp. MEBOG07]UKB81192.1 hypothetical protein LF886_09450 [Chryseobacterium sp. MEBOG07]
MKKLLFASACALTLLSCVREESEIQGENDSKNINKSTLVKGGEASKTWERVITRYYSNTLMKHYYGSPNQLPPGFPALGWRDEGTAFILAGESGLGHIDPLYSMVHPGNGDNVIIFAHDIPAVAALGYQQKELIGYAYGPDATPVYRYYRPSKHGHLYTTNWNELGGGGNGWTYEGIFFYAK